MAQSDGEKPFPCVLSVWEIEELQHPSRRSGCFRDRAASARACSTKLRSGATLPAKPAPPDSGSEPKNCATNFLGTAFQDVSIDWVAGVGQWNASFLLLACCKTLCYQLLRRSPPRGPASSSVPMAPSRPSQERWASSRLSAPRAFSAAARSGVTSESRSATSEQHHRRTQWTRN